MKYSKAQIKAAIDLKNLSQTAIAKEIEVGEPFLSMMVSGKNVIVSKKAEDKLIAMLQPELEALYQYEVEKSPADRAVINR